MPPAPDNERLFNARVLLKFAAQEIREGRPVDSGELAPVVQAADALLRSLYEASATLGVQPPEPPKTEAWVQMLDGRKVR
jgi:hypothetical protein